MAMTEDDDTVQAHRLGVETAQLNGHTVDELSAYLDAGRTPADLSIDESAGCQIALDAMERLRALAKSLIELDAQTVPPPDESWLSRILEAIASDARAGRRIPISHPAAGADLGITEGAVRGLVRAAETDVDGAIIGRCRLVGDVTIPGEPITVAIDASVVWGRNIQDLADQLRSAITRRLAAHTELNIASVDVTVYDIHQLPGGEPR
jgi:hypothetical protein